MTYCRVTNETFTTALGESVAVVFHVVSYEVDRLKREEEMLKKYKNGGYKGM